MSKEQTLVEVDGIDCRFEPKPWSFALDNAAEIERRWRSARAEKPRLYDGRVLLMHRGAVETTADGRRRFRGAYLETGFKAFLAWQHMGCPAGIRNGFGMAALRGADGAYLLGEMAGHTANAGAIYFASGTPDPSDIAEGTVDIEGSVTRELREETGIAADEVSLEPGFAVVMDRHRVGFMKSVRSSLPAEALKDRIEAFLCRETQPELSRIHIVRCLADIGPRVQVSCATFLRARLER